MGFFKVNRKLLPIKLHYFFFQGGAAPLRPFLTVLAVQRGYSAILVGVIFSVLPVITTMCRPIFGAISDRFHCRKKMLLWAIMSVALSTISYAFLPDNSLPSENVKTSVLLRTYSFWLFFLFLITRSLSSNVVTTISDTICLESLGDETHKYGVQRVWGAFAWGAISCASGILIDLFSTSSKKDYTPALILSVMFFMADFMITYNIEYTQKKLESKNMFHDLKEFIKDFKVLIFILWLICFGIISTSISLYLIWHIEIIGSKYYPERNASMKTLEGILITIKTFGGEVPFFILSGKIIQKVGHVNSMAIGFASLSLRCWFYYYIKNPLWILPVELLSGLGYALPYSAMASYAGIISPSNLRATVQGVFGTVCQGVGGCLGSLITGYLFQTIGSEKTYQIMSVFALVICVLQYSTNRLYITMVKAEKKRIIATI